MFNIVSIFCACLMTIVLADPERPRNYLAHNRTVTNCAKYKREANQHQCVLSPFNTEGPYFLPDDLERSDITDGQAGVIFDLTLKLVNSNDCTPLSGYYIHIWHCNATGAYSGVREGFDSDRSSGDFDQEVYEVMQGEFNMSEAGDSIGHDEPACFDGHGDDQPTPTSDERFLRGYQVSNEDGEVTFRTIVPGWYSGRCIHIHMEVYPKNSTNVNDVSYVGQIFFEEGLADILQRIKPYSTSTNIFTSNSQDGIYNNHGEETIAELQIVDGQPFKATMTFGIDPTAEVSVDQVLG